MSGITRADWHPTQHTVEENVAHLCARLTHKTTEQVRGFVVAMTQMRRSFDLTASVDLYAANRIADAMDACSYAFRDGPETDRANAERKAAEDAKDAATKAAKLKAERDASAAGWRAVTAPFKAEREACDAKYGCPSPERKALRASIARRELAACNAYSASLAAKGQA